MLLKLTGRVPSDGDRVIEVDEYTFRKLPEPAVEFCKRGSSIREIVPIVSRAFVMNDVGDTIDAFPKGR